MKHSIITTDRDARALSKDLRKVKLLPFDSETDCTRNGFDWLREHQIMWQFVYRGEAFLIDLRCVNAQIFKPVLESPDVKKIIHSSLFDGTWTRREHDITIQNIGDTRLNENQILGMAFPRRPLKGMTMELYNTLKPKYSAALEWCLHRRGLPSKMEFTPFHWYEQFVDIQLKEGRGKKAVFTEETMALRSFRNVYGTPKKKAYPQILKQYNGKKLEVWVDDQIFYSVRDVEFLIDIYNDQCATLAALDMDDLRQLEEHVTEVTIQMSTNGFGFNAKPWSDFAKHNEKKYYPLINKLQKIADINWESPAQYCKYFGAVNADHLDSEVFACPEDKVYALGLFREARNYYKYVTTYGKGWVRDNVYKNKVNCNYTQIINTGRYSCDNPNMQNIPVRDWNRVITPHRSAFVPGNYKNGVFGIADFSSQELAIMAAGSEEPFWLEVLRNRGDLHSEIAQILDPHIWNTLDGPGKKARRTIIKTINFGLPYGSGVAALAERAEVEVEEMQDSLNVYRSRFRKLTYWLWQNSQHCVKTGNSYSFPPFNRLRTTHLEREEWRKSNIGKNNPVQSTGADMTKLAMVLIYNVFKKGFDALMIHQLHDELVTESFKRNGEELKHIMELQMSRACEKILGEALSQPEVKIQTTWEKKD